MKRLYQTLRSGFTLCVGSLLLALATGLPAMAQKITVNGTIRDAAGNPVVGASIVDLKNPASGTSSGIDGAFSLSAARRPNSKSRSSDTDRKGSP